MSRVWNDAAMKSPRGAMKTLHSQKPNKQKKIFFKADSKLVLLLLLNPYHQCIFLLPVARTDLASHFPQLLLLPHRRAQAPLFSKPMNIFDGSSLFRMCPREHPSFSAGSFTGFWGPRIFWRFLLIFFLLPEWWFLCYQETSPNESGW